MIETCNTHDFVPGINTHTEIWGPSPVLMEPLRPK